MNSNIYMYHRVQAAPLNGPREYIYVESQQNSFWFFFIIWYFEIWLCCFCIFEFAKITFLKWNWRLQCISETKSIYSNCHYACFGQLNKTTWNDPFVSRLVYRGGVHKYIRCNTVIQQVTHAHILNSNPWKP